MKKSIFIVGLSFAFVSLSHAQIKSKLKSKVKEKIQNSEGNASNRSVATSVRTKSSTYTVEELDANPYVDYDRVLVTENTPIIFKGVYQNNFEDDINFSGFYYLNSMAIVSPSNHFSSDTTKAYAGFSINYAQDEHTMQVYWEESDSNYAMVPERYHSSADKGNVMFQMGMTGGPESYYNAQCLLLEPGVIVIGASVYHKNDEEGHAWMNNITPEFFVIAAKDTAKFKDYQSNVEHTSKVVFEKFDALRRVWKQGEIEDARPLPSEGMQNSKLKSEALALIKKTANAYGWKETVEYAYITSTEWDTRVSALTGKLLTRSLKCIVVMKTPDGNYKREGFYIGQKHNGSSWGNSYMLYNDQFIYYVNPKDVMKYK